MTNPYYVDPTISIFHQNHRHGLIATKPTGQMWMQLFDPEKMGPSERRLFQELHLM